MVNGKDCHEYGSVSMCQYYIKMVVVVVACQCVRLWHVISDPEDKLGHEWMFPGATIKGVRLVSLLFWIKYK